MHCVGTHGTRWAKKIIEQINRFAYIFANYFKFQAGRITCQGEKEEEEDDDEAKREK